MDAVVFAMTRASASNDADHRQKKADADALHSALRANLRACDERTARLRAMLLAVGDEART